MTLKALVNIDKYFYSDLKLHYLHFNVGAALSAKYNSGSEFYIIAVIKMKVIYDVHSQKCNM